MKHVIQPLAWGIAMASVLAMASSFALNFVVGTAHAASGEHANHAHQAADPAASSQWATDEGLREGMTRLRTAVDKAMPQDAAKPLSAKTAIQLQKDVDAAVSYMIANCKLPGEADAALHRLLIDLLKGAEALSEEAQREEGIEQIVATLKRYPDVFAAPHWN
jgi:hypothetical protein